MAATLEGMVNRMVSIITADGRNFVGTLKGFDQTINVILDDTHERVYSKSAGVNLVPLGLHIVMGANAATKIANMIANVRAGMIAPVRPTRIRNAWIRNALIGVFIMSLLAVTGGPAQDNCAANIHRCASIAFVISMMRS